MENLETLLPDGWAGHSDPALSCTGHNHGVHPSLPRLREHVTEGQACDRGAEPHRGSERHQSAVATYV